MKNQKKELRKFVNADEYTEESCAQALEDFLESTLTVNVISSGYNEILSFFMNESKSALSFYAKHQNYIKVELIQGLRDEQEILNVGVCLAVSARMGSLLQDNPLLLLTELSDEFKIKSEDRFNQASYKTHFLIDKKNANKTLFPGGIAEKEHGHGNYVDRSFYRSTEELISCFDSVIENSQSTSGICMLNFNTTKGYGHSILLVLDTVSGRYGVIDCNIGIIDFSSLKNDPKSAKLAVLECVNDLLQFYGEMKGIEIRQNRIKNEKTVDHGPVKGGQVLK